MLHGLRGALLREMPRPVGVMVSAGCGGALYFDWVERHYGPVARHIGIECYMPRPDKLPANVEWIVNTCADMSAIADETCDLVFSGQNIEHLWPDEVAGFLIESARVLKPDGWLVIDSPNRLVTTPLKWSHPEHTVELTVAEIATLLDLAGFEITKRAGLWLSRDPRTGALLPLDPNLAVEGWSFPERIVAALDRPDDAFLWWIEARRRRSSPPDGEAIRARVDAIFSANWPERVQRMLSGPGLSTERRQDGNWINVPAGRERVALFGPYMPLRPGNYRAEFTLAPEQGTGDFARFDVVAGDGAQVLATAHAGDMERSAALTFTLEQPAFGVQFRCFSTARRAFAVRYGIDLSG
jgi:SAM-dependent methyltransferase